MKRKVAELRQEPPFFDEDGSFHFRPVSSDARLAVRLKSFPEELIRWFERFETNCAFSCCGLAALGFKPTTGWDKRWNYNAQTMKLLESLRDEVERAPSEVLRIPDFQNVLYKDDLLYLIDYLQEEMNKSIRWK